MTEDEKEAKEVRPISSTMFDPTPQAPASLLGKVAGLGISAVIIACACLSGVVGVIVTYDWLRGQSTWEILSGLAVLVVTIVLYRMAMDSK